MACLVSLGDVAEFVNGAAFKPEDWGDVGHRIIRIQNLTDPSKPYNRTQRVVGERLYVQPGDLLVSWSASLGVYEWNQPDIAVLNQHIFRVLPNTELVDKRYLLHGLERALLDMSKHMHGATMLHVNRGEFLSTKLRLPPLREQRRIAAILDQADALRAKRREALAQLDNLAQSIFIEMFGDPIANPQSWEEVPLAEVCSKITDGTHKTPLYVESGVEFLSAKDVKGGRVLWGSGKFISQAEHRQLELRCRPELGDLLLAKSGSLGEVAVVDRNHEFSLFESLCLIKPDRTKIDEWFLAGLLCAPSMRTHLLRKNKGVAIKHLHLVDVRSLKVVLPPLSMQKDYSNRIQSVAAMSRSFRESRQHFEALFTSLQHRAFSGEL